MLPHRGGGRPGAQEEEIEVENLRGEKILVTGPAGQIAFPLASRLAEDNEVWGIARFGDSRGRERVEAAGIRTRVVDLADPDWADLPDDFSLVLHLAATIPPGHDYDLSLRVNAEGTGRLMSRFRSARACLVMSTCGVYASPEDPFHPVLESDPLSGSSQPYSPTYCVSKIGEEAVARFAAGEFELPITIARMNVAYGDNGGLPAMLLEMILADQPIPLFPDRASVCSPIHEDDIFDHTPGLLARAAVPATITNWGGDEPVEIPDLCRYMAELVGKKAEFVETPEGIHQYRLDPTLRTRLAGPCRVPWRDGVRRMLAARHPELPLRD
jgi:nucleoside-diphosphate-sugar epimerase